MTPLLKRLAGGCLLVVALTGTAYAQWLNYPTPGVPRTADGSPKLDAPAPTFFDGHPDLTGVWMHDLTPVEELIRLFGPAFEEEIATEIPGMEAGNIHKYGLNVLADFPPDDSPARPETQKAFMERLMHPTKDDVCYDSSAPIEFPLVGLLSEPIKIVQAPRQTLMLYEIGGDFRQVYTDGRRLPAEVNLPAYYGYSAGRWQGDTFVVETAGFNDKLPLDALGHPHSEQLHVVERYRRPDFGHLEVEMTYNDMKMYTRPWTITFSYHLLADADIFEMYSENEKDCAHIAAGQAK
jgi:hypothetical protein